MADKRRETKGDGDYVAGDDSQLLLATTITDHGSGGGGGIGRRSLTYTSRPGDGCRSRLFQANDYICSIVFVNSVRLLALISPVQRNVLTYFMQTHSIRTLLYFI